MSKQNWTDLTVILENILGADWGQGFQSGQNVVKSARLWAKSYKKATKNGLNCCFTRISVVEIVGIEYAQYIVITLVLANTIYCAFSIIVTN